MIFKFQNIQENKIRIICKYGKALKRRGDCDFNQSANEYKFTYVIENAAVTGTI